jgi:hypothetical protein
MGLDMYLERMPRYGDCTADTISLLGRYFRFLEEKNEPGNSGLTMEQWCGHSESELPPRDAVEFYRQFYSKKSDDDFIPSISEEVGYWRKANAIHNWFVENVQDGEDDCDYHREVTADDLQELITVCTKVLTYAKLVPGRIRTGIRFSNGKAEEMYENGLVVSNPGICEELLPTSDGFFFGSQEYNEYYLADLQETIKICTEALSTTDFGTQMLYYCSSW